MTYLEDAAAELEKAREANEQRFKVVLSLAEAKVPTLEMRAEVDDRRMEIAEGFTRLAAIEAGLPPCYHVLRTEQETP